MLLVTFGVHPSQTKKKKFRCHAKFLRNGVVVRLKIVLEFVSFFCYWSCYIFTEVGIKKIFLAVDT